MAEYLQGLLDRIQNDGINKAGEEKAKIVAEATEKAAKIIADAEAKAESIINGAKTEAEKSEKDAQVTIRQVARDITLALKSSLESRLNDLVKASAAEAMTPSFMAQIISNIAKSDPKGAASGIEVILPASEQGRLNDALLSALTSDLRAKTLIGLGNDFSAGLKVGFRDSDVFLDFSDEALSEIICEFAGPKLAAVIKG